MPIEKCFDIISEGSGEDFDPILVEVFLEMKDKVEEVYRQISDTEQMYDVGFVIHPLQNAKPVSIINGKELTRDEKRQDYEYDKI